MGNPGLRPAYNPIAIIAPRPRLKRAKVGAGVWLSKHCIWQYFAAYNLGQPERPLRFRAAH